MTPVPSETVVAIMAEGKENALAIGKTVMSTEEIAAKNKGIGVETYHYLNDGLWNMAPVKS
jgi:PUA domain protein